MNIALPIVPVIGVLLGAIPSAMAQQFVQIPGEQPTGILLSWSTICNTGSNMGVLLQSSSDLVNPDGTPNSSGRHSKSLHCEWSGSGARRTGTGTTL